MKSMTIQRSQARRRLNEYWPEILEKFQTGRSLRSLELEYNLSRKSIRSRLRKAGLVPESSVSGPAERFTPTRSTPPYTFNCCHCHKSVFVDPSTGDKRWKFCCRKCERAYWKHQDRNAGIRAPIYHLLPDGTLREVTKGN